MQLRWRRALRGRPRAGGAPAPRGESSAEPTSLERYRELVRWRHDEFRNIEGPPGRASWPPTLADPFPGTDTLAEIPASELGLEVVAGSILHHGCVMVRNLLPPSTVARLVHLIENAFEEQERWRQLAEASPGHPSRPASKWFEPFTPDDRDLDSRLKIGRMIREYNRVSLADSPAGMYEVCEALERAGVRGLAADYFREPPAMTIDKSSMRRVGYLERVLGFHQEASVFRSPDSRCLNFWVSLSDCGEDAPGLEVLPRRIDEVIEGPGAGYGLPPGIVESLGRGETVVPVFAPGDALVFDDRLIHRTAMTEKMTNVRYSLENWFFAPSSLPMRQGAMAF